LRIAWLIWGVTTLALGAYIVSGFVASRSETVPITLADGLTAHQKVFRFGRDHLRMRLEFLGTGRPELGRYSLPANGPKDRLAFREPGSEVLLMASSLSSEAPTPYSALPNTGWSQTHTYRDLVAELSEAPGVWRWPPANRGLVLNSGTNEIRIEVTKVGRGLVGENVTLFIDPEIGFKTCGSQVCWLWGWFAWPLFLLTQSFWAFFLLRQARRPKGAAH
jgi:hypothetical protein